MKKEIIGVKFHFVNWCKCGNGARVIAPVYEDDKVIMSEVCSFCDFERLKASIDKLFGDCAWGLADYGFYTLQICSDCGRIISHNIEDDAALEFRMDAMHDALIRHSERYH